MNNATEQAPARFTHSTKCFYSGQIKEATLGLDMQLGLNKHKMHREFLFEESNPWMAKTEIIINYYYYY
jgi:hypothetical protein